MNDIWGRELHIGDKVAYTRPGRYDYFVTGTVVGFTPKMVRVKTCDGSNWWNNEEHLKEANQLASDAYFNWLVMPIEND